MKVNIESTITTDCNSDRASYSHHLIMDHPIVEVHQGQLRGVYDRSVNGKNFLAFRGIPYAKPPIGNLRFKDCEPVNPWIGVKDATQYGDRCVQQEWITRRFVGSDDCLYLNVYTPSLIPPVLNAVIVWIHGGVFISGSGRDDLYGPDYLIEKDVVLVTINYRLGILGFLNVDDEEAPGNQGLKDQVQALKWIQQNIAQFGGDPNNVTICGDSAGGASVHYLTISPLAQGLFHKAIMQSGMALSPWASSVYSPMEPVKKLATILNKDITDRKEFVNYLRSLDVIQLIEAAVKVPTQQDIILSIHPFIPSVDTKAKNPFLSIPIEEAVKVGIKVPCICGTVSHEGIILVGALSKNMQDEINADPENLLIHPTVLRYLKEQNVSLDDIKRIYYDGGKTSITNTQKLVELLTDINFVIGLHNTVQIQSQIPNIPMYLYKFEYESEISVIQKVMGIKMKGTCHADELSFIFYQKVAKLLGKKNPTRGSVEHHLIQRLTEMWTNFAKTGNPTPRKTDEIPVKWEPVDNSNAYKSLHITDKLSMKINKNIIHEFHKKIGNKNHK